MRADLAHAVGSERVDLVDLERASGLLRYRAARDGIVLLDPDGVFPSFSFDVATSDPSSAWLLDCPSVPTTSSQVRMAPTS